MGRWAIEILVEAERDLAHLDAPVRRRVYEKLPWEEEHFDDASPSPLTGMWKGYYKFRVGDWRVAYDFDFSARTIFVYMIDRRDKIYKRTPPAL